MATPPRAVVEIRSGTPTPDSQSIVVARAADLWLASCFYPERTTVDSEFEPASAGVPCNSP